MSSAKLLLSGSLVAGGLTLGAFTLHGAFDPQRPQKQLGAAGRHDSEAGAIGAFQTRTRFVAGDNVTQDDAAKAVKARPRPDAKPADAKAAKARAAARRRLAQKRRAERERAEKAAKEKVARTRQQPQQATLQWPWTWLGN
jgi:hypothetical protein